MYPFQKGKMIFGSALHSAVGHTLHIELLHNQEQNGNGDGNQHAAAAELGEVGIDQALIQHPVQAHRHGVVGGDSGVEDHLGVDEIHPGCQEAADNGIDDNGLGGGQHDLPEDHGLVAAVQPCRLAQ